MPTYMEKFRCKCDACRAVCCRGWRIHLTKTEYLRLTALACSDSLRARIERSLTVFDAPSEDAFAYIAHGEDGRRPMLDGDGLCTLQAECGDTIQPAVCRLYPRAVRAGDPCEIVAATSCGATVELLMKEPCPLPFTEITGEISSEFRRMRLSTRMSVRGVKRASPFSGRRRHRCPSASVRSGISSARRRVI